MDKKLVSVIIPVYNIIGIKNKFRKAVYSVLKQSYSNIELILVNDGSKDKTIDYLYNLQRRDNRVVVLNKSNGGVESARRYGLQNARGEYIYHMDQDDYIKSNAIFVLCDEIEKKQADIVIGNSIRFIKHPIFCFQKNVFSDSGVMENEYFMKNYYIGFFGINSFPVNIWNKLYRKSFLDSIPTPPTTGLYNEDLSYNLHIFPSAKRIVCVEDVLYYYRWGGFTNKKINNLLEVALSGYNIKMNQIKKMKLNSFEIYTCIELLNYINSYFYQFYEYDNISSEEFNNIFNSTMGLPEVKYAIQTVSVYGKYHNKHVDLMIESNSFKLDNHLRTVCKRNKWKTLLKKVLSKIV